MLTSNIVNIDKQQLTKGRWYSKQKVDAGNIIFANHCAACHGQNAEVTSD